MRDVGEKFSIGEGMEEYAIDEDDKFEEMRFGSVFATLLSQRVCAAIPDIPVNGWACGSVTAPVTVPVASTTILQTRVVDGTAFSVVSAFNSREFGVCAVRHCAYDRNPFRSYLEWNYARSSGFVVAIGGDHWEILDRGTRGMGACSAGTEFARDVLEGVTTLAMLAFRKDVGLSRLAERRLRRKIMIFESDRVF